MTRIATIATTVALAFTLLVAPAQAQKVDDNVADDPSASPDDRLDTEVAGAGAADTEAAGNHIVENGDDSGPGSYRQAIADASADPEDDIIEFKDEIVVELTTADVAYTGAGTTLTLVGNGATIDGNNNRQILEAASAKAVTVQNLIMVDGSSPSEGGAIDVTTATVTVTDSQFISNQADNGGAIRSDGGDIDIDDSHFAENSASVDGGAIQTDASTVQIDDSTFDLNEALVDGGAIATDTSTIHVRDSDLTRNEAGDDAGAIAAITSNVSVTRSSIVDNTAGDSGGAILTSSGDVDVVASRFEYNTAADKGAGIFNFDGDVDVEDSAFTLNVASVDGGAIRNVNGPVRASATTFHMNEADRGGGIYNQSSVTATNSTFTDNTAVSSGGGIATTGAAGNVSLNHVTAAGNTSPLGANVALGAGRLSTTATVFADPGPSQANCFPGGGTTTGGHNYDTDGSCGLRILSDDVSDGDDPLLGPTRDNGDLAPASSPALRLTAFPLNGSPLIDAIPVGECSPEVPLAVDERGVDRPFGPGCDIGAIEAVFPGHGFSDVTPFYEATVRWITSPVNTPNILDGYDDGTFRQKLNITRGQVVRMYYRAAGQPDVSGFDDHGFDDVTPFFEDAVTWAKAEGVFDGFDDGTFRQKNPITRGNYIRSLYGFAGAAPGPFPVHGFTDVTPFYETSVRWAKAEGIADGFDDGTFRQKANISRGNASRTAYNLAGSPTAWEPMGEGPTNMLFSENVMFM